MNKLQFTAANQLWGKKQPMPNAVACVYNFLNVFHPHTSKLQTEFGKPDAGESSLSQGLAGHPKLNRRAGSHNREKALAPQRLLYLLYTDRHFCLT